MSMATRCSACGTIFRVVQDQLKVSEGWVRCGRCDEVFNALDALFDLERESPPPWQPGQPVTARDGAHEQSAAELDEADRIASRFFRPEQEDVEQTPAESVDERDRVDFADARFEDDPDAPRPAPPPPKAKSRSKHRSKSGGKAKSSASSAPEFLRHAEREARWRSPRARLSMALAAFVLLAALALQVAHHFRDLIAARWPDARPWLVAWCELAACRIEPPRNIKDITVESTTLTRDAEGTDTFRFAVTLRNRGDLPLRVPSVELTLTDTAGQLVARRALGPVDFRAGNLVMQPGAEAPLQVLLATGTPRVAGYTVEVFYP